MHSDRVAAVRRLFVALERGRFEDLAAAYRPDAAIVLSSDGGRTIVGGDALADYLCEARDRGMHIDPSHLEFEEHGRDVIARGRIVIRAEGGGISDSPVAWRFSFADDGRIVAARGALSVEPPG